MKNRGKQLSLTRMTYDQALEISDDVKNEWFLQIARVLATKLGYGVQCRISGCRRHKFCCGTVSKAQHEQDIGYHLFFPPCTNGDEERRQQILRLYEYYCGRGRKEDE